jgi:O-antigen/teichoic acid export membrane protein
MAIEPTMPFASLGLSGDTGCYTLSGTTDETPEPLLSSLATLGGARCSVIGMNLIAISHMARALGIENFGLTSFAMSYAAYFIIVVNLGYEILLTRQIASDRRCMVPLVNSVLTMRLILASLMSLLLICSLNLLHLTPTGRIVILIQLITVFGSAVALTSVYTGLQRMRTVALREFTAGAINMVGMLLLVHGPDDVILAASVSAATILLANATILIRFAREHGIPRLHLPGRFDAEQARISMTFFWSILMTAVTYNCHLLLLGLMSNEYQAGLFAAGWKLFNFAVVVPNLLSTLFLPRIANVARDAGARARSSQVYMQACIVCGIPTAIIGEALVPQILELLFGSDYIAAGRTVALLLVNALVVTLNIGFGIPLLAVGRQKTYMQVVTCGAAAGFVLCVALIPAWGAEGAALGTLANETLMLGLFVMMRPEFSIGMTLEFALRCLLSVTPAAIVAHFVATSHLVAGSDFIAVITGGSVGIAIYVLVLHLLKINLVNLAANLRALQ